MQRFGDVAQSLAGDAARSWADDDVLMEGETLLRVKLFGRSPISGVPKGR